MIVHRPVLSACGHLVHGVVVVETRDDGVRRTHPVASAWVRVVADGHVVATTKTNRYGTYSVVVGSCKKTMMNHMHMQVEKVGSCEKTNATRILPFHTTSYSSLIWRQDIKVQLHERTSVCEMSVPQEVSMTNMFTFDQDMAKLVSKASILVSLMWGFVLLWAIAKWTTVNQPRRVNFISDHECNQLQAHSIRVEAESTVTEEKSICASSFKRVKRPIGCVPLHNAKRTRRRGRRVVRILDDDSCEDI